MWLVNEIYWVAVHQPGWLNQTVKVLMPIGGLFGKSHKIGLRPLT